jgi:ribose/xylose/arabinose/galactoside ABC-type transport system permease subunit
MMTNIARILVTLGVMLVLVGGLLYLADRLGLPLGRLPGDIRIGNENLTCFIPLATSLVLSVVLTILLNVIVRLLR